MKNKTCISFLASAFLAAAMAFSCQQAGAQIFPQVADPAAVKKQQMEEDRKLGQSYYDNKEYDKALEIFRKLYDDDPSLSNYTYCLYCMIGLKDFDGAEKLVRNRLRATPGSRYQVDLGYVYQLSDRPDKAIREYEAVLDAMKPSKSDILTTASVFMGRGLYEFATKAYLKGREMLKGSYSFQQEIARVYELTGDFEGMINEYLDLVNLDPSQMEFVEGRLQNALNKDSEEQVSSRLREALLKRNQKEPENRSYIEMLLWLSIQQRDFSFALIQAVSMDKRYGGDGMIVFNLANLSLSNGDFEVATEAYQYILKKGPENPLYTDALTGDLKARFSKVTGGFQYRRQDLLDLETEYFHALQVLGENYSTLGMMRDLAHLQAFFLGKLPEAVSLLGRCVEMAGAPSRTIAECKLELADIFLFKGEVWEAALLYMQVDKAFKNDPLGHQAKFRNARLSYYIGEFEWAKAQLDVLKAATSKLIANDAMDLSLLISDNIDPDSTYLGLGLFSRADLLMFRNQDSLALLTLDSIRMLWLSHPLDDDILYKKAEIYIKTGNFEKADSLLDEVVKDYSTDILADNALFRQAELKEKVFRDKEGAMALYEKLMLDYPGSLFSTESRKRYRMLRGDAVQ